MIPPPMTTTSRRGPDTLAPRPGWSVGRAGAVPVVVGPVPEQPAQRGEEEERGMGPARLVEGPALVAVGGRQHCVLEHVADPPQVEPAVAGQAERGLEVLLLEEPRAKLDDQVGFRVACIPEVVRGARSDGEGLTRSELETVAVHHEPGPPRQNEEPGLLDGMDVGDAHTALRGKPGLVLQQLTIRFRNRLEEPDALAVERILDDRSGRRAPVARRTGVDGVPKYPTGRCVFARIFTPSGRSPNPPNRTCILGAGRAIGV